MATFIRIDDPAGWRGALLLGAIAIFPGMACASEAEIHVSIGSDGIEIFSNLPRRPLSGSSAPVLSAQGAADFAVAQVGYRPEEVSRVDSDASAPGKTFLQDD